MIILLAVKDERQGCYSIACVRSGVNQMRILKTSFGEFESPDILCGGHTGNNFLQHALALFCTGVRSNISCVKGHLLRLSTSNPNRLIYIFFV